MSLSAKAMGVGARKNWRRVFVLCGGGKLGILALPISQQHCFSFPPSSKYRLTLILALHCVPDAAGQKAVESLYTEVYIKNW